MHDIFAKIVIISGAATVVVIAIAVSRCIHWIWRKVWRSRDYTAYLVAVGITAFGVMLVSALLQLIVNGLLETP